MAVDFGLSGGGRCQAHHAVEGRGLARAVVAQKREDPEPLSDRAGS